MILPVEPALLGAFAVTALAIVVSPGPDTLLILRYALAGGPGAGLSAVAGVQLGLLVHTALAAAGLSVVIAASPLLLSIVGLAGAAYLAWLGATSLSGGGPLTLDATATAPPRGRAVRDAALTNLLNPKVIVLFVALYPNFLSLGRAPVVAQLVLLSAVLIAINVAWQAALALAADAARRRLLHPRAQRALRIGCGAALLVFAALMAGERLYVLLAGVLGGGAGR